MGATDPVPEAADGFEVTDVIIPTSAHPFSQHGSLTRMEPTDVDTTGLSSVAAVTGEVLLTYVTAPSSYDVSKLWFMPAAAPTNITTHKLGLYTVADNGDIALAARTANDATLAAANTPASRPLSAAGGFPAAFGVEFMERYALAILTIGSGLGSLRGTFGPFGLLPKTRAVLTGQADLPLAVAAAGLTTVRTGTPWLAAEA